MAGRKAKIGMTLIVLGVLSIPAMVMYLMALGSSRDMSGESIPVWKTCCPSISLLLGGLVMFLRDDD